MKTEIVRMERVTKSVEGGTALGNVNLTLYQGEILGVIGLNGSGKSTLVGLLAGTLTPDRGRILLDGQPVVIQSQSAAHTAGVHCIRQKTKLVAGLTIAENIFVIREHRSGQFLIDHRAIARQTSQLLAAVAPHLTPDTIAGTLSSLERHLVEIAKAIHEGARVIVMDDATDDYAPRDLETLSNLLHRLCQQGIAVLFASRRLEGILELCDRITVLRNGTTVRTLHRDEFSKQTLVKLLTGRNFDEAYVKTITKLGAEVLRLESLSNDSRLDDINLVLHQGEVLSLVDMQGDLSQELVQVLVGGSRRTSGVIWLERQKVRIRNYREAIRQGIGLIPETWADQFFPNLSLADNLAFLVYRKAGRGPLTINQRLLKFVVRTFAQTFDSQASSATPLAVERLDLVERLKILMFRWLLRKPKVLLMVKPSLRIDLVARQRLYRLIERLCAEGIAILLLATDLPEAAAISDRVIIVENGKVQGEYSYQDVQALTLEDIS